jgi:Transposase DDE domain
LDDLFIQLPGMLSEGLTTPERVTLDGTKIKANAAVIPSAAKRKRCQARLLHLSCRTDPHSSRNIESRGRRTYARVPRAKGGMSQLPLRGQCAPPAPRPTWRRSITRSEEPAITTAFKAKVATEEARQLYEKRSQIAEFPHAWSKERCALRQFRCRNRLKVAMEATWACLSSNLTRWFSIRRKSNLGTAFA